MMTAHRRLEVRAGLEGSLGRLWRYGVVLSGSGASAEDLVRATCIRALERADDFLLERGLTWWLFTIMRTIWQNHTPQEVELSSSRLETKTNLLSAQLRSLPHIQLEAFFLVCGERMAYRDAAELLGLPLETLMAELAAARESLGSFSSSSAEESKSGAER